MQGEAVSPRCYYMIGELKHDFTQPGVNRVYGQAIHPIKTYHPNEFPEVRVYLEEELQKAAETLIGKPFGMDHLYLLPEPNHITKAWYADDAVNFEGIVDDNLKKMIENGEIKGVSVEIDWIKPGGALEYVNGVAPRNFELSSVHFLKRFPPGDPRAFVKVMEGIIARLKEAKTPTPPNPMQGSETEAKPKMSGKKPLWERVWSYRYKYNLPDSAYAFIKSGGEKEDGKTRPQSLRYFPHHTANGRVDPVHLRNANQRVPQSDLTEEEKAKAKAHLDKHKKALGIGEFAEAQREPLKHGWPVKKVIKEQSEQGEEVEKEVEEVEEVEFEVAPEPALDELIESVEEALDEVNGAIKTVNENFTALEKRVEALELATKPKEKPEGLQEQAGEEPVRRKGQPKTDRERLIDHFGEETALKLLDLVGEEAYKLLPERGTKVQEQAAEEEEHECPEGQRWDPEEQACVPIEEEEVEEGERKRSLAETVIQPGAGEPMIPVKEVIRMLEAVLPPKVAERSWTFGAQRFSQEVKGVVHQLKGRLERHE